MINTQLTFAQNAELGKKILASQGSITLEQAKAQVERLKQNSKTKTKKICIQK